MSFQLFINYSVPCSCPCYGYKSFIVFALAYNRKDFKFYYTQALYRKTSPFLHLKHFWLLWVSHSCSNWKSFSLSIHSVSQLSIHSYKWICPFFMHTEYSVHIDYRLRPWLVGVVGSNQRDTWRPYFCMGSSWNCQFKYLNESNAVVKRNLSHLSNHLLPLVFVTRA